MRICSLLLSGMFGLVIAPGLQNDQKKAEPSREKTNAAILDIVMVDILTAKDSPWEDYTGYDRPEPAKRRIRVTPNTENYGPREDAILSRYQKSDWDRLTIDEMALAKEAVKDLLSRSSDKEWLKNYRPKDARIVFVPAKEVEKQEKQSRPFDRAQIFRAYPIGYSKDGKTACVHLWYPWSGGFHSGVATYVLTLRDGKWAVLVRQFIRYV